MLAPAQTLDRTTDYSTEDGAHVLAAAIRRYWKARGLFPRVWVQKVLTHQCPASDNPRYTFHVRSHMAGGQPT